MNAVRRFVRLRGGPRLELVERGAPGGDAVLMLHGLTDSWRSFEPVLPALPASLRAIVPSQRGHGDSDRPAAGYRSRDFAADAAALLDALEVGRAVVVGHSMGAANALRFAIDHPTRCAGLLLAGAFPSFADNPGIVAFHREVVVPLEDPIDPGIAEAFQRDTLAGPVADGLVETAVRESLKVPARVWRGALEGLLEDDFADGIGRIDAPVLLVHGERDAFVPPDGPARLARALRGAVVETWRGAGHAMHWEQPARFAARVAAFVGLAADRGRACGGKKLR